MSHAEGGLSSLCAQLPHWVLDEGFWALVETGLRQLGDAHLLAVIRRLRTQITRYVVESSHAADLSGGELDQERFLRAVEILAGLDPGVMHGLDHEYQQVAPRSLQRVAHHIREPADEFGWLVVKPRGSG